MAPVQKLFQCRCCNRAFASETSLYQHGSASHPREVQNLLARSWPCVVCKDEFQTNKDLWSHQRATGHCFCRQHQQRFSDEASAKAHYDALEHVDHFHCCDCSQDFASEQALDQHLRDKVHKQLMCQVCQQGLGSRTALEAHVVKVHQASAKVKRILYPEQSDACYICQRKFSNRKALDQHLSSLLHHPLSSLNCVASSKCKGRFTSPSALLSHLESGACRSGISRWDVDTLVHSFDTERLITNGPRTQALTGSYDIESETSSSSSGSPIMTPTSSVPSSPVLAPTPLKGVSQSFIDALPCLGSSLKESNDFKKVSQVLSELKNGNAKPPFRCPLCPNKTKQFRSTSALRSHLTSPAHAKKPFHCPSIVQHLASGPVSIKHFRTLSGLAQHVESGACGDGKETMFRAMGFVQRKLEEMGIENIRLLK